MSRQPNVDYYNYYAIELLERMGIDYPTESEINQVEHALKHVHRTLNKPIHTITAALGNGVMSLPHSCQ